MLHTMNVIIQERELELSKGSSTFSKLKRNNYSLVAFIAKHPTSYFTFLISFLQNQDHVNPSERQIVWDYSERDRTTVSFGGMKEELMINLTLMQTLDGKRDEEETDTEDDKEEDDSDEEIEIAQVMASLI